MLENYKIMVSGVRNSSSEYVEESALRAKKRIDKEIKHYEEALEYPRPFWERERINEQIYKLKMFCYEIDQIVEEKKNHTFAYKKYDGDKIVLGSFSPLDDVMTIEIHRARYEGFLTEEDAERKFSHIEKGGIRNEFSRPV